ncbi:hypothetical protein [Actinomadura coerulea]|uniref:hypothetical protein n=1 Tax=Actinomadura coerulea TaxID=46159 RepID=UPI003431DC45
MGAIVKVAPRLSESHEVRPDGLVISRIGMFVVYWAVFKSPGGSLAMLAPNSGYEKQDRLDWIGHFREGILDPVRSLSSLGFTVDLGSQGEVADPVFAQEFLHASIE